MAHSVPVGHVFGWAQRWWEFFLRWVPIFGIPVVIVFWSRQIVDYQQSTKGLVIAWLISAGVSVVISLLLTIRAKRVASKLEELDKRREAQRSLWMLIGQYALILPCNIVVVWIAFAHGVHVGVLDGLVVCANLAVLVPTIVIFRRKLLSPMASGMYTVALKTAPQVVQAIGLLLVSSAISNWVILALVGQGILRWLPAWNNRRLAKQSARGVSTEARATYLMTFADLLSILLIAVAWVIGRVTGGILQ